MKMNELISAVIISYIIIIIKLFRLQVPHNKQSIIFLCLSAPSTGRHAHVYSVQDSEVIIIVG